MRLIQVHDDELVLKEFSDARSAPPYGILSHTWQKEEVSFLDMQNVEVVKSKAGFHKIRECCRIAVHEDGLQYVWVDTCCIDKTSSAELSEAINSMYDWYSKAKVCYGYLSDVKAETVRLDPLFLARSRWFSRGWTLQELIAPPEVKFFSRDWTYIGSRSDLRSTISEITWIDEETLVGIRSFREASIARRMSWASKRETTREEDIAYCLLGLFGVNMPLIYGEGKRAFIRLQEEIMKNSDDQSLFAWTSAIEDKSEITYLGLTPVSGLLATSPSQFVLAKDIMPFRDWQHSSTWSITNQGLRLELPIYQVDKTGFSIGILSCHHRRGTEPLGVPLRPLWSAEGDQYARCRYTKQLVTVSRIKVSRATYRTIFIRKDLVIPSPDDHDKRHSFFIRSQPHSMTSYKLTYVWPKDRWKPKQSIIKAPTRRAALFFEGDGQSFIVMVKADFSVSSKSEGSTQEEVRCMCKIRACDLDREYQEAKLNHGRQLLVWMEELANSGTHKTFKDIDKGRRAIAEILQETWLGEDVFVVDISIANDGQGLYELPG